MILTREFLKSLSFRVFTATDYYGFQGVESPVPLMAEKDQYLVIIDGSRCDVYAECANGEVDLVAECEDITALD